MTRATIAQKKYLSAAQLFHWASRDHFVMWFTGEVKRHRRTETILPRLVKKGKLFETDYGNRIVYAVPRRVRNPDCILKVAHGLGCTETLVRFWRSDMEATIIPEREFFGCGSIPDWGLLYSNRKLLLMEFCTESNFLKSNNIKNKLIAYRKHFDDINGIFGANSIVVFVIDVNKERIRRFIEKVRPAGPQFFFTDYATVKSVPIGQQLTAPIYFWEDGLPYPLRQNGCKPA